MKGVTRSVLGLDVLREKRVVETRSIVIVPLHDAGTIQYGLFP